MAVSRISIALLAVVGLVQAGYFDRFNNQGYGTGLGGFGGYPSLYQPPVGSAFGNSGSQQAIGQPSQPPGFGMADGPDQDQMLPMSGMPSSPFLFSTSQMAGTNNSPPADASLASLANGNQANAMYGFSGEQPSASSSAQDMNTYPPDSQNQVAMMNTYPPDSQNAVAIMNELPTTTEVPSVTVSDSTNITDVSGGDASTDSTATDGTTVPTVTDYPYLGQDAPPVFMRVPFRGALIRVYKTDTPGYTMDATEDGVDFYYEPALLVNPRTASIFYNPFTNSSEILLHVFMWDDSLESTIQRAVSKRVGTALALNAVQMLYFNQIMLDSSLDNQPNVNYTDSEWMSFATQPSTIDFRFPCGSMDACLTAQNSIQMDPEYFVRHLTVLYWKSAGASNSAIVGTLAIMPEERVATPDDVSD